MSEDIRDKAFEWCVDYKPWKTDLEYSEYAREGYEQGYLQAKKDLERQLEAMEQLCYEFYNAGLSAGHPMTTSVEAKRDLKELEEELKQLKEKGE